MNHDKLRNALASRKDKLDIISIVTGIDEARLTAIIDGAEITESEAIILMVNA